MKEGKFRKLGFRPELNGIRGLAIGAVLATHAFNSHFPGGAIGVDIFFVLSGFLITSLLVEEWGDHHTIGLKNFWMRRALRLLPALVVFLPCAIVVSLKAGESITTAVGSAGTTFLYIGNIVRVLGFHFSSALGHMWSLSIEEQFYLVWPLAFLFLMRRRISRGTLVVLAALPILVVPLWRTALYLNGADYARIKLAPDTRADMLLIGCVLALLVSWEMLPRSSGRFWRAALVPAALFLTGWLLLGNGSEALGDLTVWAYTAIGLSTAILILNAVDDRNTHFRRIMRWTPLVWLGRISYGLYLWHMLALFAVRNLLPSASNLTVAAVAIPPALLIAALSWRFVEQPFLRRKTRYAASPQMPEAVTVAPATLQSVEPHPTPSTP